MGKQKTNNDLVQGTNNAIEQKILVYIFENSQEKHISNHRLVRNIKNRYGHPDAIETNVMSRQSSHTSTYRYYNAGLDVRYTKRGI